LQSAARLLEKSPGEEVYDQNDNQLERDTCRFSRPLACLNPGKRPVVYSAPTGSGHHWEMSQIQIIGEIRHEPAGAPQPFEKDHANISHGYQKPGEADWDSTVKSRGGKCRTKGVVMLSISNRSTRTGRLAQSLGGPGQRRRRHRQSIRCGGRPLSLQGLINPE
jgi:hypothetical protein